METFEVHIEIERQCGLSCQHCSSVYTRAIVRGYSKEDISNLLTVLKNYHLVITLTGGEPLLCQDLQEIVLAIEKSHSSFETGLFTTGLVLSDGVLTPLPVSMASALYEHGVRFCYFSIYSNSAHIHDTMTGREGSFSLTQSSIQNFAQAGVDVRFNTVVYSDNQNNLRGILEYAMAHTASEVRLLQLVRHGNAKTNWVQLMPNLSDSDFVQTFRELRNMFGDSIHITTSSFPDITACRPTEGAKGCQAGLRLLYITYDGFVYPCACLKNSIKHRICHISDVTRLKNYLGNISNDSRQFCLGKRKKEMGMISTIYSE